MANTPQYDIERRLLSLLESDGDDHPSTDSGTLIRQRLGVDHDGTLRLIETRDCGHMGLEMSFHELEVKVQE